MAAKKASISETDANALRPDWFEQAKLRYSESEAEQVAASLSRSRAESAAVVVRERAAGRLLDMRLDADTLTATLLVGLGSGEHSELGTAPDSVRQLVDGVGRLEAIRWEHLDEQAAEPLRRMFLAMARDVRVVLIVLALHTEQLLEESFGTTDERLALARKVMDVFAPLANRLGIWQLKSEMEDAAFSVLEPDDYRRLAELLEQKQEERKRYIAGVISELSARLAEETLDADVDGRPKHLYSIYRKMQRKHVAFEQIYDVSAVRVITDRLADCYGVLGIVHSMWRPIRGEFDDYIAMPKGNGYQSLHTAVVGPQGRPVEVQIRTRQMHRFAEFGVAAHWAYKESKSVSGLEQDRFMVVRRLLDWERELADPKQFVESLKTDVFEDQVYVFTPSGDVIDLPKGATPLDFAYRVHTQIGHRARGARVNEQIVPFDTELSTGDRVEILTHKQPAPTRDWLNTSLGYLRTAGARAKVRHWFRQQGRGVAIESGKKLFDKEWAALGLRDIKPEAVASAMGFATLVDLHAALGFGEKSAQLVASTALELERGVESTAPPSQPQPPSVKRPVPGVVLDGVTDVLSKRARCCNPLPGDAVLGFVTRGRGIVIHRRDCGNVRDSPEPERWVEIDWGSSERDAYTVSAELIAARSDGLLSAVVRQLGGQGVAVTSAQVEELRDGTNRLRLSLRARSSEQLAGAMQRVANLHDVRDARLLSR
jgi:GTP pyrophosphokinase